MDVRDYLHVVRAGWALILLGLLLGGGAAAGASTLMTPQYTATTQLFVSTAGSDDLSTALQGNYYAESKVASYAELLRSRELAAEVLRDVGLSGTPDELTARITVDVPTDTTILDVSVTDPSPQTALAVTRSLGGEFRALVRQLETPEGESSSPVRVTVTAAPELPREPSSPLLLPNVALGAALGLLLGLVAAVARDRLDTTVKDDAQAAALAGAPVIGQLPLADELSRGRLPEPHGTSAGTEAVRHVRTNLAFLDVDSPPRAILVTSSVSGEGKTTLAVHLAVALAASGHSVTLIEGDLRRPSVTRSLGLVGGVGVTNVLTGSATLDDVRQPVGDGSLEVLAAGPTPPNPSELLASEAMAGLVHRLVAERDVVVIDGPPLLPVADATALAGVVDGVLLCARWGAVRAEELSRSAATLDRVGARLLGLVLTQVPARSAAVVYGYGADVAARARRSPLARLLRRRAPAAPTPVPSTRPRPRRPAPVRSMRPAVRTAAVEGGDA